MPADRLRQAADSGYLGNRGVMDTPYNQTSYTAELIANQQARSNS